MDKTDEIIKGFLPISTITIYENDLPITVAEKIIKATKPIKNVYERVGNNLVGGDGTQDMYDIDEIKEIADYLMVYYNNNDNETKIIGVKNGN